MEHYVITIAREYGSGGKSIGKMLAKELGIPYYDRDLLRMASEESGISERLFADADENFKRTLLFKAARGAYKGEVIPPDSEDFVSNDNLFNFQAKVIKDLAAKESCIIIGRCGDYVLREMPHVVRLFVHAPLPVCIENARAFQPNMDDDELRRYVQKVNKRRANYYNYFTGRNWRDAGNYDLCINSAELSWENCVRLVRSYIEIKGQD